MTECAGAELDILKHVGNPDTFMSFLDGAPSLAGFGQVSRTGRNGVLSTGPEFKGHSAGRLFISVTCADGGECPAQFTLEQLSTLWDTTVDENSYTSTKAELRRFAGPRLHFCV